MSKQSSRWTPAMRRYHRRIWPILVIYAAVLVLVIRVFEAGPPSGLLKYLFAAAPAAPLCGLVALLGVYLVEEDDEFQRRLMIVAMLVALAATLSFATVWGFLEGLAGAPHVALWWVFAIFSLVMGAARAAIGWRYA